MQRFDDSSFSFLPSFDFYSSELAGNTIDKSFEIIKFKNLSYQSKPFAISMKHLQFPVKNAEARMFHLHNAIYGINCIFNRRNLPQTLSDESVFSDPTDRNLVLI